MSPAVNNNTNDGIPGEIDTSNKEVLSLPETKKDNDGLIDMTSPSEQDTIVVTPNGNTSKPMMASIKGAISQRRPNNMVSTIIV